MTDHKSWLWRKKPSEKTISVAELEIASKENEEKMHVLLAEKAELERDLKDLGDKLSSALAECSAKDDLVKKHSTTAKDALAGWEKAEAKVLSLKEELDETLKERDISEERTRHLDAALKECMQQLRFVREDKEQRIHDVMLKASEELEEMKMILEEKLEESNQMIAKLNAENSQLCKAVLLKDHLIEELNQEKAKVEGDVNNLLARLEHLEKDNNSLIYEVRVLEKEVDIRNEEREFNRRTADATHKQHLENVKKIAKLESECQRLRVLVRKRLPGPAALAKMKSEVDMLGRDSPDNRRKKSNLSNGSSMQLDYGVDSNSESPVKKINQLTEKIYVLEEENNSLRENLQKKMNEVQVSRNMYIQTASKLSRLEAQLDESQKNQLIRDARSAMISSHDLSLASMSDVGSDDKVSCAGSWASKSVGMSDINHLMDDFAEMEKYALVCVDKPITENSSVTNAESIGKELVPIASESIGKELNRSISKLIEIIHGIKFQSENPDALQTPSRENECHYTVRVFQWKTSELASIMQNFLRICDDLLNGKAEIEIFTQEVTHALEWIVNHCFSLQDVSSMKDEIRKQLNWDETRSESETEVGVSVQFSEAGNKSESSCDMSAEDRKVQDAPRDINSVKHALDYKSLRNVLQDSESTVASLRSEIEALKHSKEMIEEQFEIYKMGNEDLNLKLVAVNSRMDEAHKKIASLQEETKNKEKHCEELEAKCHNLQVQLERVQNADTMKHLNQGEKQLRNEWEVSGASEKLAECQETILHLGKQLQAMASSRDAVVSDKFISTPTRSAPGVTSTPESEKKLASQRSSLLDQMQAEDTDEPDQLESPKTKEIICTNNNSGSQNTGKIAAKMNDDIALGPLAIVPYQKPQPTSGGLFKKLLRRKKKGISKKMQLPFEA
ncbi:filament-like plant protein 7 [Chenopodium quinoa]|uniref:Filament-like plant protein 7 n=1 Tax=Chenopodium quinoa TaxID=63459 RepID=A0A803KY00_CHEQI|nr:filament-like plant protein 7 [Chenopodium quinoa]XP_021714337.1 filament-like plant protein 7 [Chenopodium quinoa]